MENIHTCIHIKNAWEPIRDKDKHTHTHTLHNLTLLRVFWSLTNKKGHKQMFMLCHGWWKSQYLCFYRRNFDKKIWFKWWGMWIGEKYKWNFWNIWVHLLVSMTFLLFIYENFMCVFKLLSITYVIDLDSMRILTLSYMKDVYRLI